MKLNKPKGQKASGSSRSSLYIGNASPPIKPVNLPISGPNLPIKPINLPISSTVPKKPTPTKTSTATPTTSVKRKRV